MRSFLIILFLLAAALPVRGATYYVRSGGSNGNAGTSTGTAWATLVYGVAHVAAGDTLNVGPGRWNEDINTNISGADGSLITLLGAGAGQTIVTGKFTIDLPYYVVDGFTFDGYRPPSTYVGGTYISIYGAFAHYVTVRNCEFTRGISGVICQDSGDTLNSHHLTVSSNVFHQPTGNGMVALISDYALVSSNIFRDNAAYDAIRCFGSSNTISANKFLRIKAPDVAEFKDTSTTPLTIGTGSKTLTIAAGKSFQVGDMITVWTTVSTKMEGIVTAYTGTSLTFDSCVAYGSGSYSTWGVLIGVVDLIDDPPVQDNHADIIQTFNTSGANDGTYITFENNYAEDCTSQWGNLESNSANTSNHHWTFRNNLLVRCRFTLNCYLPNTLVIGNTFFDSTGNTTGVRFSDSSGVKGAANNSICKNNLFIWTDGSSSGSGAVSYETSLTGCEIDYNFYTSLSDGSFSAYTQAGAHSINGGYTPSQIFVDYANGDFRLKDSSPAIDAGVNLADLTGDANGTARPYGGGANMGQAITDMGAFEYLWPRDKNTGPFNRRMRGFRR